MPPFQRTVASEGLWDPMGSDIKDVIVLWAAVPAKGSTQASGHQVSTCIYTFTQYYMY